MAAILSKTIGKQQNGPDHWKTEQYSHHFDKTIGKRNKMADHLNPNGGRNHMTLSELFNTGHMFKQF